MGWIEALCKTYDYQSELAGIKDNKGEVLLPLSHSTANAQIEITIDTDGRFLRAALVKKDQAVTVIPVTEDSATRGSGIAPHPLCDKLCYLAGDYDAYSPGGKKKNLYYEAYINQLEAWVQFDPGNEKVNAVYRYLIKGSVIRDLSEQKIITLDENGKMSADKIEGTAQEDAFVRFLVQKPGAYQETPEVWKDTRLYQSYDTYYQSTKQEKALCYLTGRVIPAAAKHPAKLRNTGDKAKLISSNDTSGYTYRGRFTDAGEAASLGYEASQKAHNALRWLIARQGYHNESAYIVSWELKGSEIPKVMGFTDDIFGMPALSAAEKRQADVGESYAKRLNQAIAGYQAKLETTAKIVVMAVDTADGSGQGRLAITFYSELAGSEFLSNIRSWHQDCSWKHTYRKKEESYYTFFGAPSPKEIALAAYGNEQNALLKADDKVIKKCVERILPCIVEGRRFPRDILHAAVRNAGRPMCMSGYNFNRILTNTCAMIKKCILEQSNGKEVIQMTVDYDNTDRSYLFGRLLAVADRLESQTFEREENRATNARRYWNTFSKRPAQTWKIIYEKLNPYYQKLRKGSKVFYDERLGEIMEKLTMDRFTNDPLNERYLLGYYNQWEELRYQSKDSKNEEDESNE